jgi:hypothetical protein
MCRQTGKLVLAFFVIMIVIVSCSTRPEWIAQMVDHPTCLAPCWRDITPGITTQAQLTQLLNQDQQVFDIRTSTGSIPWGDTISWCLGGSPCGPGDISAFSSFDTEGIVQEVNLDPGASLYLQDFVRLYGLPKKLAFPYPPSADSGVVLVDALYPSTGLVLEFLMTNRGSFSNPSVDFKKNAEIVGFLYTVPGLEYYYSHNVLVECQR